MKGQCCQLNRSYSHLRLGPLGMPVGCYLMMIGGGRVISVEGRTSSGKAILDHTRRESELSTKNPEHIALFLDSYAMAASPFFLLFPVMMQ